MQTNKYSKLHKCPRLKHVESIFKEFQVAPKGIKKLIFLPKETLNSNVKTCTWKSFPLQRKQVPTKLMGWGEICMPLLLLRPTSTVLSLGLAVTFPAKENRSAFTQCLWSQVKKKQEWDFEPKGFLFFLVRFHMTHWKRFMWQPGFYFTEKRWISPNSLGKKLFLSSYHCLPPAYMCLSL